MVTQRRKKDVEQEQQMVVIPKLNKKTVTIRLIGDSPLVTNRFSERAKKGILDKQMKVAKSGKEAKDPQRDFEGSLYGMTNGDYGFPAIGFKKAAINAVRYIDDLTMVRAKGAFHVLGDLIKINSSKPIMREDPVKIGPGITDIRYRGEFKEWWVDLTVVYNADVFSAEQMANLFNVAGFNCGVGEMAPRCGMAFGMFHVG